MQLVINGEKQEVALEESNVAALVGRMALNATQVAVEVNGALVRRAEWSNHALADGDRLEVVTLVGGG